MIDWVWTRKPVEPEDVLDAARNIAVNTTRITIDPTRHWDWVEPQRYLEWALAAVSRGGEGAWDCALGWAKRAVCRRMDGILVQNHLAGFLGESYKKKVQYLRGLKVPGLDLLRDIVIDPRNAMEHSYTAATEEGARQACDVAELFLPATETVGNSPAIAALGWNVSYRGRGRIEGGIEHEQHDFTLRREQDPMLLIDGYSPHAEVFVIYPREQSISVCPRNSFDSAQIMELNARLRQCLNSTSFSAWHFVPNLMKILRDQLRL